MILEFMTKRNPTNGHRHYLCIDTNAEVYAKQCRYMIPNGVEIKKSDMDKLIEQCKMIEFREVDYAY